jgi:hypothetical protein
MASLLAPVNKMIHDVSTQILDNQIPKQLSDLVTSFVSSGFHIVEDVIKIAKDLTKDDGANQGGS